jgi:hypothetical protein
MPALGPIAIALRVNIELFLRFGSANSGVVLLKDYCRSGMCFW